MNEILLDWKFLAFCINGAITITCFLTIKYNDFRHVQKGLKNLEQKVENQSQIIAHIETDVAVLKERTK